MLLRYISHADIDRQLYNSCVHFALNGRTWGYKWYLDATARRFDVLVEGEYESVMPLVWDKNLLGRRRVTMPVLTPGLGIFSVNVLSPKRLDYFAREVAARFDAVDLTFTGEAARAEDTDWNWTADPAQVLVLAEQPYEEVAGNYDSGLLRRLGEAQAHKLLVHANLKPERIAAFVAEYAPDGQRQQHPMLRILYNALHRGWGWTSAVTDAEGRLLAVAAFVSSHARITPILTAEAPFGKTVHALDLLYDYALRQSAGRPLLFEFAQADRSRGAGFGAKPENRWHAHKASRLLGVLPI